MSDSLLGTAALNKERQRYIEHLQSENHALRAQLAAQERLCEAIKDMVDTLRARGRR